MDSTPPPFVTHPLPESRNVDGRPIWEPPVLVYTDLIDEAYEKKRKAYLKYTNNDVAKTTRLMDISTEFEILLKYTIWIGEAEEHAYMSGDTKSKGFYDALREEVQDDVGVLRGRWRATGMSETPLPDGEWDVYNYYDRNRSTQESERSPAPSPNRDQAEETEECGESSLTSEDIAQEQSDAVQDEEALTVTEDALDSASNEPPSLNLIDLWW